MSIQDIIREMQEKHPHLTIENLHTEGEDTGYVRISLDKEKRIPDRKVRGKVLKDRARKAGYSGADADGILRVTAYMEEHLQENTGLEELARIAHMSPAKLKYTFSDLMYCPVREYRKELRIRQACFLLKETELDMDEIARRLGYKKTASFTELFKKQMQMSPKEYRQSA